MGDHGAITFVPTVHFSPAHRRRVRETIRATDPDLVAVELDEQRFERLDRDDGGPLDELARELPQPTATVYGALQAIQRTVVRVYGLDPGRTDMDAAIETAAEQDLDVALIDDPIAETIGALADRVGPSTMVRLLLRIHRMGPRERASQVGLLAIPFRDIDTGDDVQPAIDHMRQLLPEVATVLIDRRDRAMARRLHRLRRGGQDVVAVVGAGHHNGIREALDDLRTANVAPDVAVPVRTPSREVTRIPVT